MKFPKPNQQVTYTYTINFVSPCTGTGSAAVTLAYNSVLNTGDISYVYNLQPSLAVACPYYQGTYSTIVTSISPSDGKLTDTTANKTLTWGPSSGFLHTTQYTVVITGTMQNPNTYTYTRTLTLNVQGICIGTISAPGITMNSGI